MNRALIAFIFTAQTFAAPLFSRTGQQNKAKLKGQNIEFTLEESQALVKMLYRGILFREADSSGLRHYSYRLVKYGYDGLLDVAVILARSLEYRKNIEFELSPSSIANNMYIQFFEREMLEPTPWPELISEGKSDYAIWRIVSSDEFFEKNILSF